MGATKISTGSQATATPQQQALDQQQLDFGNFTMPYQEKNYAALSNNIYSILNGQTPTAQGVGGIDENQTQSMVNASLRDIMPQFQMSGILNSGEAAQIAGRTAMDTRNANAQFNVSAAQNLFNLASGGQSNLQAQSQANTNNVSNQLAGLNTNAGVQRNPFNGLNLGILGNWGGSNYSCWVAAEIFGGWNEPKTVLARYYINELGPKWFKKFYLAHGEGIAKFIHNKPILKLMLKPLFEFFVKKCQRRLLWVSY